MTLGAAAAGAFATEGKGAAGARQSPKTRSAMANPSSGSMSPASTSTALSGRQSA